MQQIEKKSGRVVKHSGKNGQKPVAITRPIQIRYIATPESNNRYLPHNGERKAAREMRRLAASQS